MYIYKYDEAKRPLELPPGGPRYRVCATSRVYADSGKSRYPSLQDFDKVKLQFGDIDMYRVQRFVGSGRFSAVFRGKSAGSEVAIKTYRPVSLDYLKRELFFLHAVRNCPNVIHYIDLVHDPVTGAISLVTEFVAADRGRKLYPTFQLEHVRYYMFQLFRALDACHSIGIMHRDVKPDNLLIDHSKRKLRLIDWGLAEIYFPGQQYPPYVRSL
jgi:casein kinase II subunit alpha